MKIPSGSVRSGTAVGLDIGSHSIRAAELSRARKGLTLRRFAQVGLPRGAVVGGEIINPAVVSDALRRLWSEGDFGTRRVNVALSGQRVIVRQAEVLSMSEGDFRSALAFQATDLIPIPIDDAQLDFVLLPPPDGGTKRGDHMEIVLAAAHRRLVHGHLAVLRDASLSPVVVDPAPMAAARVATRFHGTGTVAVVDVGSDLTVITVVDAGAVRFSRILDIGADSLTVRLAERHAVGESEAEAMKRLPITASGGAVLLTEDLDPLVSEIVGSLAFFETQLTGSSIAEVLLTGGASRDAGLVRELARRTPAPLRLVDPLDRIDCGDLNLDEQARRSASATCLLAVGTAEWTWESSGRRLSLLPKEVAAAVRARRRTALAAAGLVVVAAGLTSASLHRDHQVDQEKVKLGVALRADALDQAKVDNLTPVQLVQSEMQQRLGIIGAAGHGDVAWPTLLQRITAALPHGLHLTALTFGGPGASPSSSGSSASSSGTSSSSGVAVSSSGPGAAGPLGSVSMTVTGSGTEEDVAVWLRAFRHVPGLESVWAPSATASSGTVTFSSTGGIDAQAPMVHRPGIPVSNP